MSDEPKNRFGVPLSRVTRIEGNITQEQLNDALRALAGEDLINLIEEITAQVNRNQTDKIKSRIASNKSMDNGFTRNEHNAVAGRIKNIWRWAAEAQQEKDRTGKPDVHIRRFISALDINGRDVFAWLTIKDTQYGLRIYSVELTDELKLRDKVGSGETEVTATALHRSFKDIINRLNREVNMNPLEQDKKMHQRKKTSRGWER